MRIPLILAIGLCLQGAVQAQTAPPRPPLAQRIGHTDLSKVELAHSHGSVGLRKCQTLVPASAMDVNLNFVFRWQEKPKENTP